MGQPEIVDKLNQFFDQHIPLDEECHVVYVMVELRKLIDRLGDDKKHGSFTLIRFYSDWMVHTEKDRITESMRVVMQAVYAAIQTQLASPYPAIESSKAVVGFAYMENLQGEMRQLFGQTGLKTTMLDSGWTDFVALLVKVLENQPVHKPIPEIEWFCFLPSAAGCVAGEIAFTAPVSGYPSYTFKNAY